MLKLLFPLLLYSFFFLFMPIVLCDLSCSSDSAVVTSVATSTTVCNVFNASSRIMSAHFLYHQMCLFQMSRVGRGERIWKLLPSQSTGHHVLTPTQQGLAVRVLLWIALALPLPTCLVMPRLGGVVWLAAFLCSSNRLGPPDLDDPADF